MPIFRPSAIGGVISGLDSDSISNELNIVDPVFGTLIVGSKVWNIDVGEYFTLTNSSASLVTDEVLSVLGYDGIRWIKDSTSIAPGSITASMLDPGDKAAITAFMNNATSTLPGLMSAVDKDVLTKLGTTLTGGTQTIHPGTDFCSRYLVPVGSIVADSILTINITGSPGAQSGDIVQIEILDTGPHTYTIKNETGTTIATKTANAPSQVFQFYATGGDWQTNTHWWV